MTDSNTGRMLLSHNFTLLDTDVHPLNREEFAQIFDEGIAKFEGLSANYVENPHWIVEIYFDKDRYSPSETGNRCAEVLAEYRKAHQAKDFTIMALGGVKDTPATHPAPALQTGEWGVDIVESNEPDVFLEEINWHTLSGAKPEDQIFRIDCKV